ncbi:MAG: rod shape-determining protein MreD, partial [Leptolyngbya sp. SIO1D8]|nr:rod shape-determining protein MreD [Leptolyngbya sp. SIO1D8]
MTSATPSGLSKRRRYRWLNIAIVLGSALICSILLPIRAPGMELLGVGPSWLLIWVVAWSVKRTSLEGAIAGFAVGLIQDGLTGYFPTHTIGFVLVGFLTARIQ